MMYPLAIIRKVEKLKMVAQYAFKIKYLTAYDSLLGKQWFFVFFEESLFCYPISYIALLEVLILSLSFQFTYRETTGNFYCHTS